MLKVLACLQHLEGVSRNHLYLIRKLRSSLLSAGLEIWLFGVSVRGSCLLYIHGYQEKQKEKECATLKCIP